MSPLILYMIQKSKIEKLVSEAIEEIDPSNLFVVDLSVSKDNSIKLVVDGDNGVNIDDCVALSRFVEGALDREEEDFDLSVSSFGLGNPLVLNRQYNSLIDKGIEIVKTDDIIKRGILESFDTDKLILKEEIVKKSGRKSKKMLTGDTIEILLKDIKSARSIIVF